MRCFQATGPRWKPQIQVSEGKRSLALYGLHLDVDEAVGPVLPVSFSSGTVPVRDENLVSHIASIHEWFVACEELVPSRDYSYPHTKQALQEAFPRTMIYNLTHEYLLATAEYNESYKAVREELKYILAD